MRILVISLLFLAMSFPVFCDTIKIPFSCWSEELQTAFANEGKKIDLNGDERTEDSWGLIVNKGAEYEIFTYGPTSSEDLELIQRIVFEVELNHGKDNSNDSDGGR